MSFISITNQSFHRNLLSVDRHFRSRSKRDKRATKRFFKKALRSNHNQIPRVITVDKNAAYPPAIDDLKNECKLPVKVRVRQIKYFNNIIEQDHRFITIIVKPMLGFKRFHTISRTLKGIEAMHMARKGQVEGLNRCVLDEAAFINKSLGISV